MGHGDKDKADVLIVDVANQADAEFVAALLRERQQVAGVVRPIDGGFGVFTVFYGTHRTSTLMNYARGAADALIRAAGGSLGEVKA